MLLETNSFYFSLLTTTMLGNYQFVVKFQVPWRSLKNVPFINKQSKCKDTCRAIKSEYQIPEIFLSQVHTILFIRLLQMVGQVFYSAIYKVFSPGSNKGVPWGCKGWVIFEYLLDRSQEKRER